MVVIVFGLPGSGKSYFASQLAGMIYAEYINSDRLRKEMLQKRSYSDTEKAFVYNAMLQKAKEIIKQNRNVVLDATFYKNETRELFLHEIKAKTSIFFIEVFADEDIIRERLKKERPDSEADFEVYKKILQQWEPFNTYHLTLESTNNNLDTMLQKAAQFLNNDKGADQ